MQISTVGNLQAMPVTSPERPNVAAHPVGAPFKGTQSSTPQARPLLADETSGVETAVHHNSEVGMNVVQLVDKKTGEVIQQLPSRQILAMAIDLVKRLETDKES